MAHAEGSIQALIMQGEMKQAKHQRALRQPHCDLLWHMLQFAMSDLMRKHAHDALLAVAIQQRVEQGNALGAAEAGEEGVRLGAAP